MKKRKSFIYTNIFSDFLSTVRRIASSKISLQKTFFFFFFSIGYSNTRNRTEILGCSFRHQHPDWCLSSLALNSGKELRHSLNISYISYMLSTRLFKTCFHHLLSWCSSCDLCIVLKRAENNNHESSQLSPNLICLQSLSVQIVIQLSAPAEGSGFEDDDLESGDNGFPGDADEGEVAFSSWPEIAVCYPGVCI